ncbi:hypothetical protein [Flavobacterium sp. '19STA2R22 D10 B1']|uniref:hypothetical protein n=1 Tax=Flavobacterium aerium TaxID=3037261 RepID=UPI00278BE439|nr:hypothetical protein [Flavobacterium sp. '19STA2R22 D10 B1']
MILKWNAETPAVKGFVRSCVYDLTRQTYDFIPNEIYNIISFENRNVDQLFFQKDEVNKSWLKVLLDKEYCFHIPSVFEDCFPDIKFNWISPSIITNTIIDINSVNHELEFKLLESLNCKYLVIRFLDPFNLTEIVKFLHEKVNDLTFKSIDVVIEKNVNIPKKNYDIVERQIFKEISQVTSVSFFGSKYRQGKIEKFMPSFIVDIRVFSEAQENNVYFNRKLYITSEGDVKNAIEVEDNYDKINKFTTKDDVLKIINGNDFSDIWRISKDKIDVCKDCEFRYMCVDNRFPMRRNNDSFYYLNECSYNPYIAKWSFEDDYMSLSELSIGSTQSIFEINIHLINTINEILWKE